MLKLHANIVGEGPPLILLHGWGWHAGIWDQLLIDLQTKYRVYAIDLPGCGKSPLVSKKYFFADIAPYLMDIIPEKAPWVGWSLGGLFGYWMAIHYPECISHLITIASSPCFIGDQDWPGLQRTTLKRFSELLDKSPHATLLDFLQLQLRGSHHQENQFATLQNQYEQFSPTKEALTGGLELLCSTDLRMQLHRIQCPNLHILGQRDTIVPASLANSLPNFLSCKIEVMKKTGHIPFLSHPEFFLKTLHDFLS